MRHLSRNGLKWPSAGVDLPVLMRQGEKKMKEVFKHMGKAEIVIARRDVLAKLIADSGLSKRAFSEQFGFSEGWVGGILRDGRIKPQTARMIANRYGIPYEALIETPDSPVVKGAGLTSLELECASTKIEYAIKLMKEVEEMIVGAR